MKKWPANLHIKEETLNNIAKNQANFEAPMSKTIVKRFSIPTTDKERIDWLQSDLSRLKDVYYHIVNEGGTVRAAISVLAKLKSDWGPY